MTSQPFNPFAQSAQPQTQSAPTNAPAPPAQPQRPVASSMNDASQYDGFDTPFFKHIQGEFDLQVIGYVGARSAKLGRACHIKFKVLSSTAAEIPVDSEWRIAYRYDYERSEKSDLDTYGSDQTDLGRFVQALFNQKVSAGFDARGAEASLHKHDFKAAPGHVHLSCSLGKPKGTPPQQYRRDLWMPARRA